MNMATDVLLDLHPCSVCGRTFNPDTLTRHEAICAKNAHSSKRRKPFDVRKHRLRDIEQCVGPSRSSPQTEAKYAMAAQKKCNWRRKHEDFIQSIRSARTYTTAGSDTGHYQPPPPSLPNPDYIQCTYCQRRFEPTTAERHIPFCKEQSNRLDKKPSSGAVSLNRRVGYKPPAVKKKSAPCTRNPSSTPSRPPGSSLIMQNTNFQNTYTLDQTPPTNGLPPRHHPRGGTITKKPLSTPLSTRNDNDTLQYKPKTTSFSRIKRNIADTSTPNSPYSNKSETNNSQKISSPLKYVSTRTKEQHKNPSTSDRSKIPGSSRLMAALDYSDHSSEEGSDILGNSYQGSKNRGRHLTQVLHDESTNGYERNIEGCTTPNSGIHSPLQEVVNERKGTGSKYTGTGSKYTGTGSKYNTGSGNINSRNTSAVPLNEYGMPMSKFCYECGSKFPVAHAKYCCECGTKRI